MHTRLTNFLLFLVLAGSALADPSQVVVVANENVPRSLELARYYMEARGIPEAHLCGVDLPDAESMTREDYDQRLKKPLLAFLRDQALIEQDEAGGVTSTSIRYVVSIYGVPIRIEDTKNELITKIANRMGKAQPLNTAAVDSELALLLYPAYGLDGWYKNPLDHQINVENLAGQAEMLLLPARLDGPDSETVKRMIDDASKAERYGLLGRAYFDARAQQGTYQVGDYWIEESYQRLIREGFEVLLDKGDGLWGPNYPMEDAVFYLGWYAEDIYGPFMRPEFRFQPGAIAYHLHSSSAKTIKSDTRYWAGPLLKRGAAVTMGATHEPYLGMTPQLHVFTARLCEGRTFGESAYMSLRAVSWQITVLGDPLYRPFRYSLDEQIEHLEQDRYPEVEWAYLRKVNVLVRQGRFNVAVDYARQKIRSTGGSLVLREKLADLYGLNKLYPMALTEYRGVIRDAKTVETAVRVGARTLRLLRVLGEADQADALDAQIRERWADDPVLAWLDMAKR